MSCSNSNATIESSESRVQENNENPTIKREAKVSSGYSYPAFFVEVTSEASDKPN